MESNMIEFIKKFDVELVQAGDQLQLTRCGIPLMCPYISRILVPGQMAGTMGINQASCGSHCAQFRLDVSYKDSVMVETCHANYEPVKIKSTENQAEKPSLLKL